LCYKDTQFIAHERKGRTANSHRLSHPFAPPTPAFDQPYLSQKNKARPGYTEYRPANASPAPANIRADADVSATAESKAARSPAAPRGETPKAQAPKRQYFSSFGADAASCPHALDDRRLNPIDECLRVLKDVRSSDERMRRAAEDLLGLLSDPGGHEVCRHASL
jgi:hypothetical protein